MSDDQAQLSIVVSAMNEVKIYRSTTDPDIIASHTSSPSTPGIGRGASHRLLLFEVLKIQPASSPQPSLSGTLIRDVAYCPGNIRGTDMVATSSMNGTVAVYEISMQSKESPRTNSSALPNNKGASRPTIQQQQSNLTSALHPTAISSNNTVQGASRAGHPFSYSHRVTPISILQNVHIDAWSVQWDASGQILLSSGSDGTVKMWKRIMDGNGLGRFTLIAEQAGEEDDSTEEESDEDEDDDS